MGWGTFLQTHLVTLPDKVHPNITKELNLIVAYQIVVIKAAKDHICDQFLSVPKFLPKLIN
jgi:hypothetical protein